MSTLTPTSELPGGAGHEPGLDAALPAGVPDPAAIAALANAFFAALPGAAPALPGNDTTALPGALPAAQHDRIPRTLPGVAPQPAEPVIASGARAPSLAPASTTGPGVPDVAATAVPATGRPGGVLLGVPEGYAAALPLAYAETPSTPLVGGTAPLLGAGQPALPQASPVGAPPSSPYYFLAESSVHRRDATPLDLAAIGGPGEDRVTAQSHALPGADTLRGQLSGVDAGAVREPQAAASAPPSFYFTEAIRPRLDAAGPQLPDGSAARFDVNAVRRDFPILQERVNGHQLVWLDNAATTQKPRAVIDRLAYFYEHENSNIHRAAHELAARATDAYEGARKKVARFIGAASPDEVVFVRGATEAINLVAKSWGAQHVGEGDEIVVSHLEHHANIVPWQQLAAEKGAVLRVIPVDDSGQVILEEARKLITPRVKIVAVTQVSNALGTVVPVREIVAMAHSVGAVALVDGAQSVSHLRVNVQALDADFFVFSGHKIFGPTGIGVVYGRKAILEATQPWQGGGNMIADVTFERTLYHGAPARFEAGTGNIADAVGLGAALDYVDRIGLEAIAQYEHALLEYGTARLREVKGLRLIGTARDKASVLSFVLEGYRTEEVGQALNREGIAVRSGHHCAQPILRRFGVEATVRPSLAFYNTCEEVDKLASVLHRLRARR